MKQFVWYLPNLLYSAFYVTLFRLLGVSNAFVYQIMTNDKILALQHTKEKNTRREFAQKIK